MYNPQYQTRPHFGQPQLPIDQTQPSYANVLPPFVKFQPPTPANPLGANASSDFAKVWAECIASQPTVQYDWNTQHPPSQSSAQPQVFHQLQQIQTVRNPADLKEKVSRWSRSVVNPPLPYPQQQYYPVDQPPHFIPHQPFRGVPNSPLPARQPVPEPNPLHHNELLGSPPTLFLPAPRRERSWPMPTAWPTTRSTMLLNQATIGQHPRVAADTTFHTSGPIRNSMKRRLDTYSPPVTTSPEDELDTPPNEPLAITNTLPKSVVPGRTDWVDDSATIRCGNSQAQSCQTPIQAPTVRAKTPLNEVRMTSAAMALRRMYLDPSVDYTQSSQAMLAITLISSIPPEINIESILSLPYSDGQTRVIDNLVAKFANTIYQSAMGYRARGYPIPTGSDQMLWELHFVCLQRWGRDSLLAGHTESLANMLERGY